MPVARQLADNPFFSPAEKDRLLRFIQDAPDTDTAIHGDLQFGNAIFAGDARYFIDLGDFCYGYPLFDVGMVYCTAFLSEPDFVKEAFHMEPRTALRFWQAFAPVSAAPGHRVRGAALRRPEDHHRGTGHGPSDAHAPRRLDIHPPTLTEVWRNSVGIRWDMASRPS